HTKTLEVPDSGMLGLTATSSVTVAVTLLDALPILTVPGNQTINELSPLVVTNTATDTDLPSNTLTFGLVSGPSGVALNPTTGVLIWTPTDAQGLTTKTLTLTVADNGSPALSATNSF